MSITGAIVLFAVLWFVILLAVLPIRSRSQAEAGEITPGTPASAPADARIGAKAKLATILTLLVWIPIEVVIYSGAVTMQDLDIFRSLRPGADQTPD